MQDSYKTLEKPAEGLFRDRNSRFLAFGYPVHNTAQISDILTSLKKKYHDARHHCYAYCLGHDKAIFRLNDDGEPSGTAGKPIYGQLLSHDLTHTLVVVVRYFGGNLLGTSGLIHAYRSSTADMLSRASIVTRYVEDRIRIDFPYEKLNMVMKLLKEEDLVPLEPVYDTACSMNLVIRKSFTEKILGKLTGIAGLNIHSLQMDDENHC
jgi:uncharacterized YigZ family protein